MRALGVTQIAPQSILTAANVRRKMLGLAPFEELTETTSLKEGLAGPDSQEQAPRISKSHAVGDINNAHSVLARVTATETSTLCDQLLKKLRELNEEPGLAEGVTREHFLRTAIDLIEAEQCPVCDTPWNPDDLKELIGEKLKRFEAIAQQKVAIEKKLEPLASLLGDLKESVANVRKWGGLLKPPVDIECLSEFQSAVEAKRQQLVDLMPLDQSISALETLTQIPAGVGTAIAKIETGVTAIPEPTEQEAARDYLIVGQERLEAHRDLGLLLKRTEEDANLARMVYGTYANVSDEVLNGVYEKVEQDFSELYRFINRDDEGDFEAKLTPSIGKLGFDVDFYGRGVFPPGAYHSEGHQDTMGVCLYLALMKHLLGDSFTFAVLDDVLMSVDAEHRREVCALLKQSFPDTQFILTTHDEIWLRHMKTAGLVATSASTLFRKWDVDHGPTEWVDRDVWEEIEQDLESNDVREASGLLRYYLEHVAAEICHRLRARVEFRGDARFELGELLPGATNALKEILKKGEKTARSWDQKIFAEELAGRRLAFENAVNQSNVEQWQINPAIHYNAWIDLQKKDFMPVVDAFRRLLDAFMCSKCGAFFYVNPERGSRENLRCDCGDTNINLKDKSSN